MTVPFARALAVAFVGIALGFLPGTVSGAPQESNEIPVEVRPWVKEYVNEDVIKSLRTKLHDLIGEDEIGKASVVIDYRARGGMRVNAATTLPPLTSGSYSVQRVIDLTMPSWYRAAGRHPIKSKGGDYEWKMSRWARVHRVFEIDGTVVEMACADEMSFDATWELLALIKQGALVPNPSLSAKWKGKFKGPELKSIMQIEPHDAGVYRILTHYGRREGGRWFQCSHKGDKLIVVATGGWAY